MPARITLEEPVAQWLIAETRKADYLSEKKADEILRYIRKGEPTLRQSYTIAKSLRIPFVSLFTGRRPVPASELLIDKRRGQLSTSPDTETNLQAIISAALVRQEWLSEYRRSLDYSPCEWVGQLAHMDEPNVRKAATALRSLLGLSVDTASRVNSRTLEQKCEDLGVLLFASGHVGQDTHRSLDPGRFRGFCIADQWAPVIFVNSSDARSAQSFTICHEMVHLLRNQSVISDPEFDSSLVKDREEAFCNHVAAEVLMPEEVVRDSWNRMQALAFQERIREMAKSLGVSRLALTIRCKTINLMPKDDAEHLIAMLRDEAGKEKEAESKKRSPRDAYRSLPRQVGRSLLYAVLERISSGEVTYREASHVLGVSLGTVVKLSDRYPSRPGTSQQ